MTGKSMALQDIQRPTNRVLIQFLSKCNMELCTKHLTQFEPGARKIMAQKKYRITLWRTRPNFRHFPAIVRAHTSTIKNHDIAQSQLVHKFGSYLVPKVELQQNLWTSVIDRLFNRLSIIYRVALWAAAISLDEEGQSRRGLQNPSKRRMFISFRRHMFQFTQSGKIFLIHPPGKPQFHTTTTKDNLKSNLVIDGRWSVYLRVRGTTS